MDTFLKRARLPPGSEGSETRLGELVKLITGDRRARGQLATAEVRGCHGPAIRRGGGVLQNPAIAKWTGEHVQRDPDRMTTTRPFNSRSIRRGLCIAAVAGLVEIACPGAGFIMPRNYVPKGQQKAPDGYADCAKFALGAEKTASAMQVMGFVLYGLGFSGVVLGPAMGPDSSTGANWFQKNRNVEVAAAGGLLIALGQVFLTSSNDGATAAAGATKALADTSADQAYQDCVTARATWVESRKTANGELANELAQLRQQYQQLQTQTQLIDAGVNPDANSPPNPDANSTPNPDANPNSNAPTRPTSAHPTTPNPHH